MRTEDLIDRLARDAKPRWPFRWTMMLATVCSMALVAILFSVGIGPRADIASAIQTPQVLFKFVIAITLVSTAVPAMTALSSPGVPWQGKVLSLALFPVLIFLGSIVELPFVPEPYWLIRMIGRNGTACMTALLLLSIGPLFIFLLGLKRGAPSYPGAAGATAGLAASGIAETFYAANCSDDSALFVMFWYTASALIVVTIASFIGTRLLRW